MSRSRDANPVKSADNGDPLGLSMAATAGIPIVRDRNTDNHLPRLGLRDMDALSHMYYKGHTNNGVAKERVVSKGGAGADITAFKRGFVGRGV